MIYSKLQLLIPSILIVFWTGKTQGQDLEEELQKMLDLHVAASETIGVNLLVDIRGLGTWSLASGLANTQSNQALQIGSKFRVGSVTKPFIAALTLQLAEQGLFELDSTIEALVPNLLPNGSQITVRHLLGHRSGLKDHLGDTDLIFDALTENTITSWTPQELVQIAVDLGSTGSPGQVYHYSNTNFVVLGLLIEAVTGKSLSQILGERLFTPLGLSDTSASWGTAAADSKSRGYTLLNDQLLDVTEIAHSHEYGNGSIVSTANDLNRFLQMLLNNQILGESLTAEMLNVTDIGGGFGYGLGIVENRNLSLAYGHDGREVGYGSQLWFFPDKGLTIVVLANITQADTNQIVEQTYSLITQLEQTTDLVIPTTLHPELGTSNSTSGTATTALFAGGAKSSLGSAYKTSFSNSEPFDVIVNLQVEPEHIGLSGNIYIVGLLEDGSTYARNSSGSFYLLDQTFSNLSVAESFELTASKEIVVLDDFLAGENSGLEGVGVNIIVGYSLQSSPEDIYYHSKPVSFFINTVQ